MKKAILAVCCWVCSYNLHAQILTGEWEGYISAGAPYWKINIVHIGDSCIGTSYDEAGSRNYCLVNFTAHYNAKKNEFKGGGLSFIERKFGHELFAVKLAYYQDDTGEYLRGTGRPKSGVSRVLSLGANFRAVLRKVSNRADTTAMARAAYRRYVGSSQPIVATKPAGDLLVQKTKDEVLPKADEDQSKQTPVTDSNKAQLANAIAQKKMRESVVIRTIETQADSVKIILYDDGEIDGDIVTIFDNDEVLIKNLQLTRVPFERTLYLPQKGSKHVIELMAENEGSIPPNTAYMLVLADGQRVEVKASSDRLSNAAIVIQKAF